GLYFAYHIQCGRPVIISLSVDIAGLIGTSVVTVTTICTIEPHFKSGTVIGEKLFQLVAVIFDIGRFAVVGAVTVPRRHVYPEFKPVTFTGFGNFFYDISFTVFVGTVFNGMFG